MNSKDSFNSAARKEKEALDEKTETLREERDRKLKALENEQDLRKGDDMEKERQKTLLEQNSLDCKPSYARRTPLTAQQLEEKAMRIVETRNLKESNAVRDHYKHEIMVLEYGSTQSQELSDIKQRRGPRRITGVFNNLPKNRDGNELERER